jgi:protein-S-isoprenylcysteine O-methyltransferase Ste14
MLFFRALVAFVALPVIVAGLLPWLLVPEDSWRIEGTLFGWPVLMCGIYVLSWCVRDFYAFGRGTLAPWDPPRKLVIVGLYRFMRNPMYVGVLGIVSGWSLLAGSPFLAAYTGLLALGFHLRVIFYEEPRLARRFTTEWVDYRCKVNRWLPKSPNSRDRIGIAHPP